MKKIAFGIAMFAALALYVGYNVWRANEEPVTTTPGAVQLGAQQLHDELQKAKTREAEIEKQDWNSIPLLRELIHSHQHRIEQLSGNTQASEIVAHDNEAIARIQKRIADLNAAASAPRTTTSPESTQSGQDQPAPEQNSSPQGSTSAR